MHSCFDLPCLVDRDFMYYIRHDGTKTFARYDSEALHFNPNATDVHLKKHETTFPRRSNICFNTQPSHHGSQVNARVRAGNTRMRTRKLRRVNQAQQIPLLL